MLGKEPNKIYDPFLKAGLGYKNPKRLKKTIAAQQKMYHGEMLHSINLKIDSPDSEKTLEDAEGNRLKMRNNMVQLNYGKLNALYETFFPQQEPSVEQIYFSFPSTSNDCSESKEATSDLPIPKMPKEKQKNEMLRNELEKSSRDSKDIQANLLKRIKILENDFKRSQAQSIDFELKLQHQKEKMACDVSWMSRLSTLNDENRTVYPPVLSINYFCYFLDILRNYDPMDDEPMWVADHVVAPTPGSAITIPKTANEFAIKGNHLTLVKGNQFDGRTKTDPHKHIHEFLGICDMFKYRDTENEVVRLMMFPLSLTGEAKTWLDELNEGTIET
ncbi:hypothetical protein Tco_0598110 [Tanacetum coccineum]